MTDELIAQVIMFASGAVAASLPSVFAWLKAKAEKTENTFDDSLVKFIEQTVAKAVSKEAE